MSSKQGDEFEASLSLTANINKNIQERRTYFDKCQMCEILDSERGSLSEIEILEAAVRNYNLFESKRVLKSFCKSAYGDLLANTSDILKRSYPEDYILPNYQNVSPESPLVTADYITNYTEPQNTWYYGDMEFDCVFFEAERVIKEEDTLQNMDSYQLTFGDKSIVTYRAKIGTLNDIPGLFLLRKGIQGIEIVNQYQDANYKLRIKALKNTGVNRKTTYQTVLSVINGFRQLGCVSNHTECLDKLVALLSQMDPAIQKEHLESCNSGDMEEEEEEEEQSQNDSQSEIEQENEPEEPEEEEPEQEKEQEKEQEEEQEKETEKVQKVQNEKQNETVEQMEIEDQNLNQDQSQGHSLETFALEVRKLKSNLTQNLFLDQYKAADFKASPKFYQNLCERVQREIQKQL